MTNETAASSVKGKTFEVFKQEIEKRLGNKVAVETHHSGTLFNQKTQIQAVQLGSAQFVSGSHGSYGALAPKIGVLSLPFLFPNPASIEEAVNDPVVRKAFEADLEKKNLRVVGIWLNGPRDIASRTQKPILLPGDLQGVKIRVQSIPVDIKTFEAFGANVVTLDWTEVPAAMQQGVIDAAEPTPNALVSASLPELITQTSKVSYRYDFYLVATNKQWWDGLAPDVRAAIQEAMKVTQAWNWENADKENQAGYVAVAKAGKLVNEISPAQHKQWVAAVQGVWKQFGDDAVGPEIMGRLREIYRKHSGE
jgi:C4-dicarboxylate-binding protein DctP